MLLAVGGEVLPVTALCRGTRGLLLVQVLLMRVLLSGPRWRTLRQTDAVLRAAIRQIGIAHRADGLGRLLVLAAI
ncbi:MAG: hypothetical protein ACLGH7_07450, partial [Actinomycetes bacterium]